MFRLSLIITLLVSLASGASAQNRYYMSLENCTLVDQAADGDGEWARNWCDGYGNVQFEWAYDDARDWPILYKYGFEFNLYEAISWHGGENGWPGFFGMPSKVVEFRYDRRNDPHSLIFRINYSGDLMPEVSRLFVVRLGNTQDTTCVIGIARTNQQAIDLAESDMNCERW